MSIRHVSGLDKQTITIDLKTSSINDMAHVISAARRISSSNYHRYGSTIEFYVPNMYVDRFVNTAEGDGLNVII